jgi:hypothetical protein
MRFTGVAVSWAWMAVVVLLATWDVAFAQNAAPPPVLDVDALADRLGTAALAAGALGTAAFGIVDGLKLIPWIDLAGFERLFSRRSRWWPWAIRANLDPLVLPLETAYGEDVIEVLKAQYRSGRAKGDLPRTLRQGVRIGLGLLPAADIANVARGLGVPDRTAATAARALEMVNRSRPPALGQPMPADAAVPNDDERAAIARLETAIDARIDAALVLAEALYVTQTKVIASLVAVGVAIGAGTLLKASWGLCLIIGLAAVPLAPVAHDAATALQQAVKAIKAVKGR